MRQHFTFTTTGTGFQMKCLFLLILSVISTLQAQQLIDDFRPDALGNVWEYSWQNEPYIDVFSLN